MDENAGDVRVHWSCIARAKLHSAKQAKLDERWDCICRCCLRVRGELEQRAKRRPAPEPAEPAAVSV